MGHLTLVRHGQASFFAADYDHLSPLGQQQAKLLGDYWVARGLKFSEVYTGPRLRQQQTAELVGNRYRSAGLEWPEPIVVPELDEYDLDGFVHRLAPALARQDRAFAGLIDRYRNSMENHERERHFQSMFEVLMSHWQTTTDYLPSIEYWQDFRQRVRRGLDHIRNRPGAGRRVVAFTSGGVIGTSVHLVLDTPDRHALDVNWRVRNCSLTEFVFNHDRITLDSFNAVPHLGDERHWTYR